MKTVLCISSKECASKSDICSLLERAGFRTIKEDNMHSALFLLASGVRVRLIVADLRSDVPYAGSGLRYVKQIVPDIPIIVLSSGSSVLKYMHARYLGVSEYLHMPVSDRELLSIVDRVTAGPGVKLRGDPGTGTAEYRYFCS